MVSGGETVPKLVWYAACRFLQHSWRRQPRTVPMALWSVVQASKLVELYVGSLTICSDFASHVDTDFEGAWSRGMIFVSHDLQRSRVYERSWVQFPQYPFFLFLHCLMLLKPWKCERRSKNGLRGGCAEFWPGAANRVSAKTSEDIGAQW